MSENSTPTAQRAALRRRLRAERAALTPAAVAQAAQRLAERLLRLPAFADARHIAGYLAMAGEMDPRLALERALMQGKSVYVPVLRGDVLAFAPWTPESAVTRNHLGIAEPAVAEHELRAPHSLDVVLVPLLAFDRACNRLGMGGGFYDRSFAQRLQQGPPPLLVGVAHEAQRQAALPHAHWDVPLDAVVTDRNTYWPPASSRGPGQSGARQ